MIDKTLKFAAALLFATLLARPALADSYSFDFINDKDAGMLANPIATLTFTDIVGGVEVTLQNSFGWIPSHASAFITELGFAGPTGTLAWTGGETITGSSWKPTYNKAGLSGLNWTVNWATANGPGRFTEAEFSSWTILGAGVTAADFNVPMHVHLQGLNGDFTKGEDSAWVRGVPVTPVPEPGSMAMLLAGLGLMGVVARRRSRA
ncbi:MAG TPA: PEP-CTERM sorting domain-containing protein [Candidatus Desulfobacillus sp.]|nr:PEP-CTERM sorting domain-containing protein [Candidatus Desulfobacillus sp.]